MTDGPLTDFELYYTKNGLVQVSNDVRRQILHELEDRNLSLTELSKMTGKAQSTLSVHLDKMVGEGLITVHDDPEDSRRKVYSLISVMLAYSKPPSDEAMTMAMKVLSEVADDPVKTRDALARFIFLGFDGMGLSVGPMATILGSIHAMALGGSLTADTVEGTVANARDYYRRMGFGEASIYSLKPLSIIIKDDLSFTEDSAKSLGYYATGFFSKILEDSTGRSYTVASSEVFGTDCNYFRFTLEPVRKRSSRRFKRQQGPVSEGLARDELHSDSAIGHPPVPVAGSRGGAAAYHEPSHEHRVPVDQPFGEEGSYRLAAAFHQQALDADILGQVVEDPFQVYAVGAGPDGLFAVPFAVASLQRHHDRGGALVQNLRIIRRPSMRIDDYADRIRVIIEVLERQMGIVCDDCSHAHQYGVIFAPESFGAGLVLLG